MPQGLGVAGAYTGNDDAGISSKSTITGDDFVAYYMMFIDQRPDTHLVGRHQL